MDSETANKINELLKPIGYAVGRFTINSLNMKKLSK